MAGIGGVVVQFRADADKAIRETRKFVHNLDRVDGAAKKAGSGLKKGLAAGAIGVGAAIAGAGAALIQFGEAAVADAASAGRLEKTLKNVTKATGKQVAAVEEWITTQGIAKGIADDQLRPALARLVRSTKDVGKAQDLATLAMDISAGTGKDYNTVVTALAKANDGQIISLKKLGITLGENAENAALANAEQNKMVKLTAAAEIALDEYGPKSKEYARAQDKVAESQRKINDLTAGGIDWQKELSKEFKGQGEAQANSVEGTWARIKLIFSEGTEAIGGVVLKPLESFADWLKDPKHIKEVEDFLAKTAEAADAIGQDVVDRLRQFVTYAQSPEGAANIRAMADSIRALGSAVAFLAGGLSKLDRFKNWLKGSWLNKSLIPDGGKTTNWTETPWSKPAAATTKAPPTRAPGVTGGAYATSGGKVVNVTINNAIPEKTNDNIALAARLARWNN